MARVEDCTQYLKELGNTSIVRINCLLLFADLFHWKFHGIPLFEKELIISDYGIEFYAHEIVLKNDAGNSGLLSKKEKESIETVDKIYSDYNALELVITVKKSFCNGPVHEDDIREYWRKQRLFYKVTTKILNIFGLERKK